MELLDCSIKKRNPYVGKHKHVEITRKGNSSMSLKSCNRRENLWLNDNRSVVNS